MATFRLIDIITWTVQVFEIGQSPPYLAISHAWSDRVFPKQLPLAPSFGSAAIQQTLAKRALLHVRHCWVDLFCILQDSDQDMCEQIPLMGRIYGDAQAVLVILTSTLRLTQAQVDHGTAQLDDALAVWHAEAWTDDGPRRRWTRGAGRAALVHAMDVLARFTDAAWGTRVWTLQEYLLATELVWIGADLEPVSVRDELFAAIPHLCEELGISECARRRGDDDDDDSNPATARYERLFSHFAGMAARRTGATDRTRVMEMLGNRAAFLPVDEVYGAMAVSTVEIAVRPGEPREDAWRRWTETALEAGHLRWLMVPPAMLTPEEAAGLTCAEVVCAKRHVLSSASGLDTVTPYGPMAVSEGTVLMTARPVGACTLLRELGPVHRGSNGWVHRDLTLILYAKGNWFSAVDVAVAFGAGRYSNKQLLMIAQTLVNNYERALRCIDQHTERAFYPLFPSERSWSVWADFMQLQSQCVMDTLNFGFGYLIRVAASPVPFVTVLVTGGRRPQGELVALDCNARGSDGRHKLLVGEKPEVEAREEQPSGANVPWHKAGVTISVGQDYACGWNDLPLVEISIGGSNCHICQQTSVSWSKHPTHYRTRSLGGDDARTIRRRLRKRRRDDARRRNIRRIVRSTRKKTSNSARV